MTAEKPALIERRYRRAEMWLRTELPSRSRLYPPSSNPTTRPAPCFSAIRRTSFVISEKSVSSSMRPPSGSPRLESKQAEAHRLGNRGMVAGRANQTKGPSAFFLHHGIHGGNRRARCQTRHFERLRADASIDVDVLNALLRHVFYSADQLFAMATP